MPLPGKPVRILLKTTIGESQDDWGMGRFSLLARHLASLAGPDGRKLYEVVSANRRDTADGDDADLADLAQGRYDQLWLIAADVTGALTAADAANIQAFRAKGGGVYLTRDHQDLGACLAKLGALGATQHFHHLNPEPGDACRRRDDPETLTIDWPNYHSGANGDLQQVEAVAPLHPIMRRASGEPIERLPAHPHEGAVGAPDALKGSARLVARGHSQATGAAFGLCVAVEEPGLGRAVSDSSFHHVADYNWDPRQGCPSFVTEPTGDEVLRNPHALDDVHAYVANIAAWLERRI
jgi:hypothetical protein